MNSEEAKNEIMRIVKFELPKVKTVLGKNGVFIKATKKDLSLSKKLSTKIAELMLIIEVCDEDIFG